MTVLDALKDIQTFVSSEIETQNILLQKEETAEAPEYVAPYVELCFFPHKNFMPIGFQSPGVLVAMDESTDGAQENTISVRLLCTTYGGGYYKDENEIETGIPDAKGYIDLLNLMERLKIALVRQSVIGRCAINKPVTMGIYDTETSYPYWYGYLTFDAAIPTTEYVLNRESEGFINGL